jgi:hypothetical protein
MKKSVLASILAAFVCFLAISISGCGGGGGGGSTSNNGSNTGEPVLLSTFGDEVAECTPQVQINRVSSAEEEQPADEYMRTITNWSGWNVTQDTTIFHNLFTTDCIEGLFDPIDKADMFITIINSFSDYWQVSGEYDGVTLPIFNTAATLTVDTSVDSVTIPFFGGTQAVDRLITVEGSIDGINGFEAQMAFSTGTDEEAIVVWTYFPDKGETSMFYGTKNASGEMDAWAACFVDHGTPETTDDFQMALKWKGNPDEKRFAVTQYKSGGITANILAGGSPDSEMAFLAKLDSADDIIANGDPYYLVCTLTDITENTEPHPAIINGAMTPPHQADNDVLKYIENGNDNCLGYLAAYPEQASDVQPLN